jgi:hypothetical protein
MNGRIVSKKCTSPLQPSDVEKNPYAGPISEESNRPKFATLSFPVSSIHGALYRNENIICSIINKRKPELLLCAGWTLVDAAGLNNIVTASNIAGCTVILEADCSNPTGYIIRNGNYCTLKQYFTHINGNSTAVASIQNLDLNISSRCFSVGVKKCVLLVCGEILLVDGRSPNVNCPCFGPKPSSLDEKRLQPFFLS